MNATKRHVKIIHVLVHLLKIRDDDYRAMLSSYGVGTSKKLTYSQADEFVRLLQDRARAAGLTLRRQPRPDEKPFDHLGDRPGYASPAQLRKIAAMWAEVSRAATREDRKQALDHFLARYGVERIEWLTSELAPKVIKALATMKGTMACQ